MAWTGKSFHEFFNGMSHRAPRSGPHIQVTRIEPDRFPIKVHEYWEFPRPAEKYRIDIDNWTSFNPQEDWTTNAPYTTFQFLHT